MKKTVGPILFSFLLLLVAAGLVAGCGQDWNSNSGDGTLGDLIIDCSNPANDQLCAAATVLQSKCFSCHSNWAAFDSSQDYVDAGMVVPGNTSASPIINRLVNSGSNMPPTGGALPASEYNALVAWVNGI